MLLEKADKLAGHVKEALAPFCDQIEIVGSVRRRRPVVNDLDLVCLPKLGEFHALRARVLEKTYLVLDGAENLIVRQHVTHFQIDIFVARPTERDLFQSKPGNFGSLLICRTGSKEHNIYLVETAKRAGLRWNPYYGVYDGHGHCIAAETEADIFRALGLDFIPPEKRER